MNRAILITTVAVTLGAWAFVARAPAQPAQTATPTEQIRTLEAAMAAEKDPYHQQHLADQIELLRHQMGPRDDEGNPNHGKALWHDAAIETLDAEIRNYRAWPKTGGDAMPGIEARLQVRRMAQACLTQGWAMNGRTPKYQFDAFGQYLANNLPLLDELTDATGASLSKPAPAGADAKAYAAAVALAKESLGRLTKAADQFCAADPHDAKGQTAAIEAMGLFADGLRTAKESHDTLRRMTDKSGKAAPPAAKPEDPAGFAALDKENLKKVHDVVTALAAADPSWKKVREGLDQLTGVFEQGLQMPTTQTAARNLLQALADTSDYLQGLLKSKSATPQLLEDRRKTLETALGYLATKANRPRGLTLLHRLPQGDRARVTLDASSLSPEASKGILTALALAPPTLEDRTTYLPLRANVQAVVDTLDHMRDWPPKATTGTMLDYYKRSVTIFLKAAEAAGKTPSAPIEALAENFEAATAAGHDVSRVVLADKAIRAAAQVSMSGASEIQSNLLSSLRIAVGASPKDGLQDRQVLDRQLIFLQGVGDLQFPGQEHMRVVNAIGGNAYGPALSQMNQQLSQGVEDAAKGMPFTLSIAQNYGWLFRALRHRGVVQTSSYAKTGVSNMDDFSMSEKTWTHFLAAYDGQLHSLLSQVAATVDRTSRPPMCQGLSGWDAVYGWVAWAQRQTPAAHRPGESELDFLLRSLSEASAPGPSDRTCFGWAVGYHAAEAATAQAAGFEMAASWHRKTIQDWRLEDDFAAAFLFDTLDPAK